MDATDLKLPDNVESLRAIVLEQQATIAQLQRENTGLSHRLDLALRRIYGRSSEKIDPQQLMLFGQAMQTAAQTMEATAQPISLTSTRVAQRSIYRRSSNDA